MKPSIGDLRAIYATYYTGPVKPMPPVTERGSGVGDLEWQMRNWYNFVWLSGDAFGYTNFLAGEPNNFGGNEDYLEMFDPATGLWNDISTLDASAPLHYAVVELDSCACDWDASGTVNSQDFFDFLADFFAGDANFNCDGATNSQDFFDFLACFFSGCE